MYISRRSVFLCPAVEVQWVCNRAGIMDCQTRLVVWVGFYTFLEDKAFEITLCSFRFKNFLIPMSMSCCCNPQEKKRRLGRLSFEIEGSEQAGGCHGCFPLFRN